MATPQLSPGVLVREVDLTVGRGNNVLDNIGAIAGPFRIGPVDEPIQVSNQQGLINTFGTPLSTDRQYEYWMSASSFLSYGGVLKVVRTNDDNLTNGNAGVGIASTSTLNITNYDDYESNHTNDTTYYWAARNPGSWSNSMRVCVIDDAADQIIGITTTNLAGLGATVGYGVTSPLSSTVIPGAGSISNFDGYLKGIITGVSTDATNSNSTINVKILSRVSTAGTEYPITYKENDTNSSFEVSDSLSFMVTGPGVGAAGTVTLTGDAVTNVTISNGGSGYISAPTVTFGSPGIGTTAQGTALISSAGIVTSVTITNAGAGYTEAPSITFSDPTGTVISTAGTSTVATKKDWYNEQTLGLTNSTVYWKSIAPKPISSNYSTSRSGRGDSIHVVVYDDTGSITGIQGNILEKHLFLSKASDAGANADNPTKIYYKDFVARNSTQIFPGYNPSNAADSYWNTEPLAVGFSTNYVKYTTSEGLWGQTAQDTVFSAIGNVSYDLGGGKDYSGDVPEIGGNGGMEATLGNLATSYRLFSNRDDQAVDYLIMGPGLSNESESQAKANLLISIAEGRKDCVATVGPHRDNIVNVTNSTTQTTNLLRFFNPLQSSSYAVFDSGYKYTYDRFNNEFRYIPTNGDVAGLMVRTGILAYPWFSPAGLQRGVLNNAVKLAYNPDKSQRDLLYPARVNSIINRKGSGVVLFGDKTALGYSSAFDRINVRRLFLTVEQALEEAAQTQLFELNDENTRANFVNIVEPYLRDVQAKRGLYDFLVVCDTSNNTPEVIDNNEFRADIYLKPTKSINYITLTFVATRTGVAFEEVVGTV